MYRRDDRYTILIMTGTLKAHPLNGMPPHQVWIKLSRGVLKLTRLGEEILVTCCFPEKVFRGREPEKTPFSKFLLVGDTSTVT